MYIHLKSMVQKKLTRYARSMKSIKFVALYNPHQLGLDPLLPAYLTGIMIVISSVRLSQLTLIGKATIGKKTLPGEKIEFEAFSDYYG